MDTLDAKLSVSEASLEDGAHVVGPACVPGDVILFVHYSVEKVCNSIGEGSNVSCSTVDFSTFN